jgi:ATP-binding cassette subfamily D (ALD) long-chain fatty acid import protein
MELTSSYSKYLIINPRLITTDIRKFCETFASLYSNIGKPVLDIIIFNFQLARTIGVGGMTGLLVNYYITATIMRALTPAFGKLAAQEAKYEVCFVRCLL